MSDYKRFEEFFKKERKEIQRKKICHTVYNFENNI